MRREEEGERKGGKGLFLFFLGDNGEGDEEGKGREIGKVKKEGVLVDLEVGDVRGRVRKGEAGFFT